LLLTDIQPAQLVRNGCQNLLDGDFFHPASATAIEHRAFVSVGLLKAPQIQTLHHRMQEEA